MTTTPADDEAVLTVHRAAHHAGPTTRAHLLVDDHPPLRVRGGHVLDVPVPAGTRRLRVAMGGARSHTDEVDLEPGARLELRVDVLEDVELGAGSPLPGQFVATALVPGLGPTTPEGLRLVARDGTAFSSSRLVFWSFLLAYAAPPVGLVVALLALRRPGLSTSARLLVLVALWASALQVLVVVVVIALFVWDVTSG